MQDKDPKPLMYYGQYLKTQEAINKTDTRDRDTRYSLQKQFLDAVRGFCETPLWHVIPDFIKLLIGEAETLGYSMIYSMLKQYSFWAEKNVFLIDTENFLKMLGELNYHHTLLDFYELKFWMFNHCLFAVPPKFYSPDRTLMNITKVMDAIV